jgi:mannose-6-phosphate isomerase-like protein (cupin superfamily)
LALSDSEDHPYDHCDRPEWRACEAENAARPHAGDHLCRGAGTSARVAPYRDGALFTTKFSGNGGWERHRNGDELVHIIDGATTLHLMTDDGPQAVALSAGMLAVVPQGMWHRFDSPDGVTLMTATPQPTDHPPIHVEDPRTLD